MTVSTKDTHRPDPLGALASALLGRLELSGTLPVRLGDLR